MPAAFVGMDGAARPKVLGRLVLAGHQNRLADFDAKRIGAEAQVDGAFLERDAVREDALGVDFQRFDPHLADQRARPAVRAHLAQIGVASCIQMQKIAIGGQLGEGDLGRGSVIGEPGAGIVELQGFGSLGGLNTAPAEVQLAHQRRGLALGVQRGGQAARDRRVDHRQKGQGG